MRIRQWPAVAFAALVVIAAYLGLAPQTLPSYKQSDKVLHFLTFLLLTLCFYWIIETSRRRVLHLTIFVCPVTLGVGSEIAQGLLPNGREFDAYDIIANVLGSAVALGACTWYHKRMLDRKRQARGYNAVSGEDDVELGESVEGPDDQESGVTGTRAQTLDEEVDNWDENNWEDDEPTATEDSGDIIRTHGDGTDDGIAKETKKRSD